MMDREEGCNWGTEMKERKTFPVQLKKEEKQKEEE